MLDSDIVEVTGDVDVADPTADLVAEGSTPEEIYPDDAPVSDEADPVDEESEVADKIVEEDVDLPAIDAPASWTKEDKAAWDALPREVQDVVTRRESERDAKIRDMGQDVARAKESAGSEAVKALATHYEQQSKVVMALAERMLPAAPDDRLLNGDDAQRMEHYAQTQRYNARINEIREVIGSAQTFDAQADVARKESLRIDAGIGWRSIANDNPDWFEPSTNDLKADVRDLIETTGVELGYPVDLSVEFGDGANLGYAEIGPQDIFAIKIAADWRAKAKRWDDYQTSKMAGVRAAKTLPKTAVSTSTVPKKADNWLKQMYPND